MLGWLFHCLAPIKSWQKNVMQDQHQVAQHLGNEIDYVYIQERHQPKGFLFFGYELISQ